MKRPDYGPRPDYGLGETTQFVKGPPRLVNMLGKADDCPVKVCPYCGCVSLAEIEVDIENPLLRTGRGIGRYVSCVACPWASTILMIAGARSTTKDS